MPANALTGFAEWNRPSATAEILPELAYLSGNFVLSLDENRRLSVVGLRSGNNPQNADATEIPDFVWPDAPYPHIELIGSPDDQKIVLSELKQDSDIARLHIIDTQSDRFASFAPENIRCADAYQVCWIDGASLIVRGAEAFGVAIK